MNHRIFTRILLALGLLFCAATAAYAVKAYPYPITITQPDGTTLTIQIHGDEFLHWTTVGNRLVEKGEDGFYYYASFNSDGTKSLSKTRAVAGSSIMRSSGQPVTPPQAAIAAANIKRSAARIGNPDLAVGKHQFLVMLIEFSDLSFSVPNPQQAFSRLLNEPGYSDNGATGSSYDFYYGNSDGRFDPSFDVIGPIKVDGRHAEYGDAQGDEQAAVLLAQACRIADAKNLVDFSVYDQDNNGTVDNIFFFFAGSNAAEGGGSDCIWPHQWTLYDYVVGGLNLDGVNLNTSYACTSEYNGSGAMAGIGTFTHEFGHVIGLPDFYDTDYDKNGQAYDPGELSLMASGSYNNNGRTPPYLSGYERSMLGWLELEEWTESGLKTILPIQENVAYMTPTNTEGEFYVYEYRNGEGYDAYIPGDISGMIIYHVDRSSRYISRWENNTLNAYADHMCYDVVESVYPEGAASSNRDRVFPGASNNRTFNANSQPAAVDWSGVPTGYNLSEITDNGDNLTLVLSMMASGPVIQDFLDANVNAIYREDSYRNGDTFEFMVSMSNTTPIEIEWYYDDEVVDPENLSVVLTTGVHTVKAILTYSDNSKETITTLLNVE